MEIYLIEYLRDNKYWIFLHTKNDFDRIVRGNSYDLIHKYNGHIIEDYKIKTGDINNIVNKINLYFKLKKNINVELIYDMDWDMFNVMINKNTIIDSILRGILTIDEYKIIFNVIYENKGIISGLKEDIVIFDNLESCNELIDFLKKRYNLTCGIQKIEWSII